MKPSYFLNRSGGLWEGHWWCADEARKYYRVWSSPGECEHWCSANGFRFILIAP